MARPTASAVLGDLIDAARNLTRGAGTGAAPGGDAVRPMDELRSRVLPQPRGRRPAGVLAAVATVFGNHGVSIRTMEQEGLGAEARLIFLTHAAREGDVQATLDDLRRLATVDRVGAVLRVSTATSARSARRCVGGP